ncbi:MAG: sporulation integral membrane protein YlbJ [Clostridia bacterium]|nr:sporulation integral membrane protein YlbJ [Clostridia bacterium]
MKNNSHFVFLSFKKNILPFIFVCFTICLVIFSKQNLQATKSGLLLWANSVVPALLPFFIATELLSHTNIVTKIGKLLNKFMRPIFNVPGIGAYAFVMGIISGYPVGAKIVTQFRNEGLCSKVEAERLLAFTNNSGPLFIIGTVGITMFGNTQIGILLFITHFISCLCVGFLFRFWKYSDSEKVSVFNQRTVDNKEVTFSNLGEVLANSILNAIHTIIMIGGFVIIFSVIISILNSCGFFNAFTYLLSPIFKILKIPPEFITPIVSGICELTNGLNLVCNISIKAISNNIIITSFLLGFGGISVLLQVLSITSKSDISIKAYFYGKLIQGTISAILTYVFIHIFPIFNLDIVPVFSQNVNKLVQYSPILNFYSMSILIVIIFFTFFLYFKKKVISKSIWE